MKIKKGHLQHQVMPHDAETNVSNVPEASFYLDLFFLIFFFTVFVSLMALNVVFFKILEKRTAKYLRSTGDLRLWNNRLLY